ncbi:MAG TPA: sulfur transferase domain-containing protein [Pseudomonadales bacterium]|nr:sulfur transferase domain-containing protein [Pseudomonadales bacterium]
MLCCLVALAVGAPARADDQRALQAGPQPELSTLPMLHDEGVRLIVDLRTPSEGIAEEAVAAAEAGIRYVNLPVGREAADPRVVARLEALVEETDGDVLLHCHSGNRAGEVLARYLLTTGMPRDAALDAGRAAGLQAEREVFVDGPADAPLAP